MLVGLTLAALATPASAAGNRALDREIITNPVGGVVAYPTSQLGSFVNTLVSIEKRVFGAKAKTLLNAAQAWHLPSTTNDFLFITLVAFDGKGLDASTVAHQAASLADEAAHSFCSNAASTTPFIDAPTPTVPNSHYVICSDVGGINMEAITTSRHGILELVTTQVQTLTSTELESIARTQYERITALPPATVKSSWTTRKEFGVGAAVLALIAALTVLLMVRRNRRIELAAHQPPSPGWYPDPRRPKRQRYWTGADWGPSDRRR
ncbi:MAG TPA: DUF2510 domain-containing protein [Acidimicrobiales bacterium]